MAWPGCLVARACGRYTRQTIKQSCGRVWVPAHRRRRNPPGNAQAAGPHDARPLRFCGRLWRAAAQACAQGGSPTGLISQVPGQRGEDVAILSNRKSRRTVMGKHTPLYKEHESLGAKLVDFAGWDMPIHYGSQIDEHKAVRATAGMFDVSHMAAVDIVGADARSFLRHLWANDVAKADTPGKAIYTCMLNTHGGVVDDLIVYHLGEHWYRTVVNAANTDKDLAWMQGQAAGHEVEIKHRSDLAIIAVQGPQARQYVADAIAADKAEPAMQLKPFRTHVADDWVIGRTGYTGEDGFELMLPADDAPALWRMSHDAGVTPAGLGARDTLRLEAGLNLYGQDMDEDRHPLESGLGWTVAFEPAERN